MCFSDETLKDVGTFCVEIHHAGGKYGLTLNM